MAMIGDNLAESSDGVRRIIDKIQLGLLQIRGMKIEDSEFILKTKTITAEHFKDGKLNDIRIVGLSMSDKPFTFSATLDLFEANNIGLGTSLFDLDSYIEQLARFEGATFSSPDILISLRAFQIPKPLITQTRFIYETRLDDLLIQRGPSVTASTGLIFNNLDVDSLLINSEFGIRSERQPGEIDSNIELTFDISASPLAGLSLAIDLLMPNYAINELSRFLELSQLFNSNQVSNDGTLESSFMRIISLFSLRNAHITLIDESLLNSVFEFAAESQYKTKGQMREETLDALNDISNSIGLDQTVTSTVAAFLKEPGTLTISMAPVRPILFLELGTRLALDGFDLDAFNISLSFDGDK